MTRVLLVDDDPLVCGALEMMLSVTEDIEVVGSVQDGDQVVEAIHRHRPEIVLMDIRMARQDGITTTAALTALPSAPKVIMLTTWDSDDVMLRSVHAGASGFLLKSANPHDIIKHVRDVASGEGALSARSARQLVEHLQSDPARDLRRAAEGLVATLTERERDVARCVAREMTTAQIAAELYLGEATVKSHLSSVQLKLGAQNRVGIGIIADRAGLV